MSRADVLEFADYFTRPAAAVIADLERFEALLRKWQPVQNLVSRETLDEMWSRHFADSLQLLPLLGPAREILDLGSGGGFPALPLAIALKGRDIAFTLVEPTGRKASFLRTVGRELGLDLAVRDTRAQHLPPGEIPAPDVITSRALMNLDGLLALCRPFWGGRTRGLFHKGREYDQEVNSARRHWRFDLIVHSGRVAGDGVVLAIEHLRARAAAAP